MAIINSEHQFLESLLKTSPKKKESAKKESAKLVNTYTLTFDTPAEAWKFISTEDRRFPELEPFVLSDVKSGTSYLISLIYFTDKKIEKLITYNADLSRLYAMLTKKPFKSGEKVIATDGKASYEYAEFVIKGRWKPGEKAIATDSKFSYDYAVEILKDRFKLGEKAIKADSLKTKRYLKFLVEAGIFTKEQAEDKNWDKIA